jgi:cAMP phosphodiesterase
MDHIASLPIFLETVLQSSAGTATVHAGASTIESLRSDLFNNRVWPDFLGMSDNSVPFVKLDVLEPGRPVDVAGLRLTPIAVDHVVPTLGFLVEARGVTVAIPSDTGPTEEFWRVAGAAADLKAVFLEASFPNAMSELAVVSKHLTPAMFAVEARKLRRSVPFIAVHIKPRFYEQVIVELNQLDLPDVRVGQPGSVYEF